MSARHRRKRDNAQNLARQEMFLEKAFKPAFIYILLRSLRETVIPAKMLAETCDV